MATLVIHNNQWTRVDSLPMWLRVKYWLVRQMEARDLGPMEVRKVPEPKEKVTKPEFAGYVSYTVRGFCVLNGRVVVERVYEGRLVRVPHPTSKWEAVWQHTPVTGWSVRL